MGRAARASYPAIFLSEKKLSAARPGGGLNARRVRLTKLLTKSFFAPLHLLYEMTFTLARARRAFHAFGAFMQADSCARELDARVASTIVSAQLIA